jgi:hypothetical protein
MRSARVYAVVAVVLVVGALLGAVSLAWGDPGVIRSNGFSALNPEPAPGGGGGEQTPLLMRVLDAPQPVKGSDGKYHLVYELVLTNSSPGTAKVESIQTMDAKSGEVVDSLAHADVAARTLLLGDISGQTAEEVGSGRVALVLLDATFEDLRDVPKALEHRVQTSFEIPPGLLSNLFPAVTTDTGGGTGVLNKKPVVISPPVKGKNWVAFNGCCVASPHRGAMVAIDQTLIAAERYAIDWEQTDDEGRLDLPDNPKLTDFPAYGKPIFSVANGKVVKVVDKFPDLKPGVLDQDLTFKDISGNHVIVDIGGGRYAFYLHLKPGSMEVEEGDHVRNGQRIARLGNSGNSSAPHLHFHVMDEPLMLGAAHNLPYVFDSFTYRGRFEADGTPVLLDTPEHREDELPLYQSFVNFPAP